ncbi:MAG: alpha/beta hydrolase [Deltaproteobacteria bacterium]|nr:alpha/beta hydrolase [Deltaproteobacteria bacterium]
MRFRQTGAFLAFIWIYAGCGMYHAMKDVPMPPGASKKADIAYYQGEGADQKKHRLDIYIPPGEPVHPVVIFVHGGAWKWGDRDSTFDTYGKLGKKFVAAGILTVVISYRLAPEFKHPAQVRDVARAIAWVKKNIGSFGGSTEVVFLMGHSAGAHLVALVAADPVYLRQAGVDPAYIKGVIAISGPYDINMMAEKVPKLTREAFGDDQKAWTNASAATHLKSASLPRFLVAIGDGDPEGLHQQARAFIKAVKRAGGRVKRVLARGRNHFRIIYRLGEKGDALGDAVKAFILRRD